MECYLEKNTSPLVKVDDRDSGAENVIKIRSCSMEIGVLNYQLVVETFKFAKV